MTKSSDFDVYIQEAGLNTRSFRFAGIRATSQSVVLPVLVFLSLNLSSIGLVNPETDRLIVLRISFAALVSAWLYFSIFGWAINANVPLSGRGRTSLVIVLYGTTELLRTVLLYEYSVLAGLQVDPDWGFRISGGLTTGIVLFAIMSTVLNDSAYYRSAYRELFNRRQKLQATLEASQNNLARTRDQLIANTRDQIAESLRSALSESEKQTPQYSRIVDQLFEVAQEVVRPLSHRLFENPLNVPNTSLPISAPRVPLLTFWRDSTIASPFRPGVMLAIGGLLSLPSVIQEWSWNFTLFWLVGISIFYLAIWLSKKFITPNLASWPYLLRIVVISVAFWVPSAIFTVIMFDGIFPGATDAFNSVLYGSALGIVLGWLVASSAGMRASRQGMLSEVQKVNEELEWVNTRLQSELWVDQKNLALTLHNEVQATLLAAGLKLKASLDEGQNSAHLVMPEIQKLISRSINFATDDDSHRSLAESIQRINDNWAGLIFLRFTATSDTQKAVNSDVVTRGVLEDILSEFQNNSLKHGKATETTAVLTMPGEDVLQVSLTNNGNKITDSDVVSGLGSVFLKSVSLSYKLENYSRGVKLTVRLPLSGKNEALQFDSGVAPQRGTSNELI